MPSSFISEAASSTGTWCHRTLLSHLSADWSPVLMQTDVGYCLSWKKASRHRTHPPNSHLCIFFHTFTKTPLSLSLFLFSGLLHRGSVMEPACVVAAVIENAALKPQGEPGSRNVLEGWVALFYTLPTSFKSAVKNYVSTSVHGTCFN